MIRYFVQTDKQLVELDSIEKAQWIHITGPVPHNDLLELANKFDFAEDFLIDSLDWDERSRFESEDDTRFILVNSAHLNEDASENEGIYITIPIGIILTSDIIITISPRENAVMRKFTEGRIRTFNPNDERRFILQIFSQITFHYLDSLKKLSNKRVAIENELYDSARNEELKHLLRIEKSLVYFVNSLSANELLKMKMKRVDLLGIRDDEELSDLFEDIIIDNSQALEMANVHTNILSGTMEAYASIVSNNMNSFIQRLTVITIVLMVPTLVASFYGMNLKNLPLENSPYAFYVVLLISLIISLLLVWSFKRKHRF